jgi:hypothetical protein
VVRVEVDRSAAAIGKSGGEGNVVEGHGHRQRCNSRFATASELLKLQAGGRGHSALC